MILAAHHPAKNMLSYRGLTCAHLFFLIFSEPAKFQLTQVDRWRHRSLCVVIWWKCIYSFIRTSHPKVKISSRLLVGSLSSNKDSYWIIICLKSSSENLTIMTQPLHQYFLIQKSNFPKCLPQKQLWRQITSWRVVKSNAKVSCRTAGGHTQPLEVQDFLPQENDRCPPVGNQWLSSTGSNTPVRFIWKYWLILDRPWLLFKMLPPITLVQ